MKIYVYHAEFSEQDKEGTTKKVVKTREKNIEVAYKTMVQQFGNKNFLNIEYKYTQYK